MKSPSAWCQTLAFIALVQYPASAALRYHGFYQFLHFVLFCVVRSSLLRCPCPPPPNSPSEHAATPCFSVQARGLSTSFFLHRRRRRVRSPWGELHPTLARGRARLPQVAPLPQAAELSLRCSACNTCHSTFSPLHYEEDKAQAAGCESAPPCPPHAPISLHQAAHAVSVRHRAAPHTPLVCGTGARRTRC